MLQAIRDGSKGVAAKIIVGLIILTFALFGVESIVALGGGDPAPAEVNGKEITETEVAQAVSAQQQRLQQQLGENFDPSMFDQDLLRQSAVNNLINQTLLEQAATDSGIYVSNQAVDQLIVQSPQFQVAGTFDPNQYDLLIRSRGFTRMTYREAVRESVKTQQAQAAWQGTEFSTPFEQKRIAKLETQTRSFDYKLFELNSVKDEIQVSEEEIQTHYDAHLDDYLSKESVVVDYIRLDKQALTNETNVTDDEVRQRYEDMLADAAANKEYRAAHILKLNAEKESEDALNEAKQRLENGESFEALAEEYSDDDTSKYAGGDLGFASTTVYEPEFAQALLELDEGEVSGVVRTRDGLHLIKLVETRQPEVASFAELKDTIKRDLISERAEALYIQTLEDFKNEVYASRSLESPAEMFDLKIETSQPLTRDSQGGIAEYRGILEQAFSEPVIELRENSEVIEIAADAALALRLKEHNEPKPLPLETVRDAIERKIVANKAADKLTELAEADLESLKGGNTITGWKSIEDATRNATQAPAPVVNEAFTLALGSETNLSLIELGNGNKALVKLTDVNRDTPVIGLESAQQKIERTKGTNIYRAYFNQYEQNADIERN